MTLTSALAIYFIIWWLTLFTILPWGAHSAAELDQEVEKGQVKAAPVNPRMALKLVINTIIASIIFGFVYWLITSGVISLDDIPFFPTFRPIQ